MSYVGNQPTTVAFLTDQFNGNGSTTAFTLSAAPANPSSILVAISGVLQNPSTYSVSGTTLTFSPAPPSGTGNISVRFLGIPASGVTTTAYRTQTDFTATAGQTTFTPPSYTVGYIDVYRNGAKLGAADFTATNGTTVVLASAASSGDLIQTVSFYVSSVLNAIPATNGAVTSAYLLDGSVTQAKLGTGVAGNGPAFSASPSSNQTISHNTVTKILLQTEQYDTNNNFASSTFTPTVAGYYNVMGQVRVDYASSKQIVAVVYIYKNGSTYFRFECSFVSGTGGSFTLPINQIIPMNGSTDTMELYYYFYDYTSFASYPASAAETRFQGALARTS